MSDKEDVRCSFCLKPKSQIKVLMKSPINEHHICDRCVEACKEVMSRSSSEVVK